MTQVMIKRAVNLVCVQLAVHIWSGRRHLEMDDLLAASPELRALPSEELATLGAYKICDPELVKRFQQVKGKAERYLKRVGLPFLGASGVPEAKFESEVFDELTKFEKEFATLQADFIKGYDDAVEKWRADQMVKNPKYAHLFNHIPTKEHVASKLSFAFHAYRIDAPSGAEGEKGAKFDARFHREVGGLKGELLKEVADEATLLLTEYRYKKDAGGQEKEREYVNNRTLGPLKRAARKLNDFRFLDPSIGPLADMIQDVIDSLGDGRVEGQNLVRVFGLSKLLADPIGLVEVAQSAMDGQGFDDILSAMNVPDAPAAQVPTPGADPWQEEAITTGELKDHVTPASQAGAAAADMDLSLLL